MRVAVIGTGYVGLVTGACLAHLGHSVICVDSSVEKIAILTSGGLPIWEQGLYELLNEAVNQHRIQYTTDIQVTVQTSEVIIICVGTPIGTNGEADLNPVWSVVAQVAQHSIGEQTLIIKSTVPVGTTDEIEAWLGTQARKPLLDVLHNPEFLRQGNAIHDCLHRIAL